MQFHMSRVGRWPLALTLIAVAACADDPLTTAPRTSRPSPDALDGNVILVTSASGANVPGSLQWAVNLADGDGTVEGHHWRGGDREQLVVQVDDLRPVGLLDGRGIGMHGVDGRLELIGTRLVAAKAAAEDRLSFLDLGPIPLGAVLLAEQHERAVGP